MPRVRILPEILSNKIAAGEVVERPASVVKELVENAIDAQSTAITVEVEKGGRTAIRVSDNGIGMDRDDALLALERYATSKIFDEQDLFSIASLGFRGEALPSIAAVSEMEIVTRSESERAGVRIKIEGGHIKDVSEVGVPRGTVMTVNRLFFNTPARRKYLKTDRTEMGHVSDTVTRIAMAWPRIHFKFFHDGRSLGNWAARSSIGDRIVDVLSHDLENDLMPVDHKSGDATVGGFVASPEVTRSTSRGQYAYVNGRFVRDKLLTHAIMEGFSGKLVKGSFPVTVLFITTPPEQVDVNVHPTKTTVRFQAPQLVHDLVVTGIRKALEPLSRPSWGRPAGKTYPPPRMLSRADQSEIRETGRPGQPSFSRPSPTHTPGLWEKKTFGSLTVIGQLHNTYILCESDQGLVMIDQHAAHERIVFEELKKGYAASKIATQPLLLPEKLELGYREAEVIEQLQDDLGRVGVDIAPFGGNTYLIRSVPQILIDAPIKRLVLEVIDTAVALGVKTGFEGAVDDCLAVMACHSAVRAKKKLSREEMEHLLRQMDMCEDPSHCPHGRPTVIRRSLDAIEKDFKRRV
jgi:DNA mismatch repair protein MutL